jgi:hypothetical protein
MYPLPLLTPVPAEPLCRAGGHTCAACCWGDRVGRAALARRLRRQGRLFARLVGRSPTRLRLLLYELAAGRGAELVWGLLLLLPLVGDLLRPWLKRRTACPFLAFEGQGEARVGCLLHPARWDGADRRGRAFAWRRGFGCGPADYVCLAGYRFRRAPLAARRAFLAAAAGLDWFSYSAAAGAFPGPASGSAATRSSPPAGPWPLPTMPASAPARTST